MGVRPYTGEIRHKVMKVEIDANSGFCGGVIRAISTAEDYLSRNGGKLFSLGAIVHNDEELSRLEAMGLIAIDKEDLDQMQRVDGETLLVRAHGEPPEVYGKASSLGFKVIDCTCPVVLKLQRDIREAYSRLDGKGSIVIYGKIGHPEVLGLVGQVGGDAIVLENKEQLESSIAAGQLDTSRPVEVFSQTTMSPVSYSGICSALRDIAGAEVVVHQTVCSQVSSRHAAYAEFSRSHDVVVFVSGKTSSNGRVLRDLCKSMNIRTFHISRVEEINPTWFSREDTVGVCGATSTPQWLLEKVARAIENLQ